MATTNHLGITLVEQSQAQKEVTVNQALTRIDAVLNSGAISQATNTPPGSPSSGDLYIVSGTPTGDWAGQARNIAYFDQIWRFITPREGISLWVNDEDLIYTYDGSAWVASTLGETNTASNLGTGEGVFGAKSGVDLQFKSLVAGSNISLSSTSTEITITGTGSGTGDVTGPSSSVDSEIALFSSTTGKVIKRATGSGIVKITSGVMGTATAGTDFLDPSWAGSTSLTTLGTITTGVWNGTIITSAYGGTGNGFTKFSGPASSEKIFTLPNASDTIACLGQKNTFTKQQNFGTATLTDGAFISWDLDNAQTAKVTLGGNRTLSNPTNLVDGGTYVLRVIQDGTGSRTLSYGSAYKWPGGTPPTLSTAVSAMDILTFVSDGTNMYGVAQKGFA